MKKGFAVEGFIREDGTVGPYEKYDDTELRAKIQKNADEIDNLKSAKIEKVDGATAGHIATLKADGGIEDGGAKNAHTHSINDVTNLANRLAVLGYRIYRPSSDGMRYSAVEAEFEQGTGGKARVVIEVTDLESATHPQEVAIITGENMVNLRRALEDPDDVPTTSSDNLITSGAVKTALDGISPHNYISDFTGTNGAGASVKVGEREDEQAVGEIELTVKGDGQGTGSKTIAIDYDNIGNLDRALKDPSTTPENDATKLITSKAVYDALAKTVPYYNGTVLIKHVDDTIAYPVAGDDDVKNSLLALYNAIPNNTYVLCRVILDNSDYSETPSDIVTVPALAYAETGHQQDDWEVSILLANGVTFTAGQQGTIAAFWTKKTSGFFS